MQAVPVIPEEITDQCRRGGSLLIGGGPGSGKTILAFSLLYALKALGHRVIFVSTRLPTGTLLETTPLCRSLGLDHLVDASMQRAYSQEPAITSMPLAGIADLSMLLQEKADRDTVVALDSWDALLQREKGPHAEVYATASEMLNRTPGSFILTTEQPSEFNPLQHVVDAYLTLGIEEIEGDRLRFLKVEKMRGRIVSTSSYLFTLTDGVFKAYNPQDWWLHVRPLKASKLPEPVPDRATFFSTGVPKLDKILGGGYGQGSTVGIEVSLDAPHELFDLTFLPTAFDFLVKQRPMLILPPEARDEESLWETVRNIVDEKLWESIKANMIDKYAKVLSLEPPVPKENQGEGLGKDIENDLAIWRKARKEMKYRFAQPMLYVVGYDTLVRRYGSGPVEPLIGKHLLETRMLGDLMISIVTDDLDAKRCLMGISDYYLQLRLVKGIPLLRGIKPRTASYVASLTNHSGFPNLDLDIIS